MGAYASFNLSGKTLEVSITGLQYSAIKYDRFQLYIDNRYVGSATSQNYASNASLSFYLPNYISSSGNYTFGMRAVWGGVDYPINGSASLYVDLGGGGGYNPPQPSRNPYTTLVITRVNRNDSDYVSVDFRANGYGTVYLTSITRDSFMGRGYINSINISESDLNSSGQYYGTISGSINHYPDSLGDFPIGTFQLADSSNSGGIRISSNAYYAISPFNYLDQYRFNGTYLVDIVNGNVAAANIQNLTRYWTILVNYFFYLHATQAYYNGSYNFSNYVPSRGEILTASMYNGLLDRANECKNALGVYSSIPSYVRSGDIISRNFIYDLMSCVNDCIYALLRKNR